PVDLAALPAYDRNREFDGFRGFGVAHPSRAEPLPPVAPKAPKAEEPESKIVRLEERRSGAKRGLTETERSAFQEIAARLREEMGARPQPAGEEKPEAGEPASPAPAAAQELAADKPET